MSNFEVLRKKIEEKTAKVGVIGLGYVGLPLALGFTKAGFSTYGIDINSNKIKLLQSGQSYISDVEGMEVSQYINTNSFFPTTDYSVLKELDVVSICVPTPLNKNQEPDTSYIVNVVKQIKIYIEKPLLIILESTTYPGTTEELIELEIKKSGLIVGRDYFLCFSPERIDPGNSKYNTFNTPKIIGGTTNRCLELGMLLYSNSIKTVLPVSSPRVAEMSKLLENTFRSVNIAFINEMALMCEKMNVDVWEVINAASTKPFGFMPFYPGPGIGGHCIPLDPIYLSWKAKEYHFFSKFINLSQMINDKMPEHVLSKTKEILKLRSKKD